jgi:hypothetical protein
MVMVIVLFPSLIATALCATAALAVNSGQDSESREHLLSAASGRTAASRIPLSFWMVAIMTIKLIPTSTKFSWERARMALQKLANYHRALPGEESFSRSFPFRWPRTPQFLKFCAGSFQSSGDVVRQKIWSRNYWAQINEKYGYRTTVCSAIATWAVIAGD